MTISNESVESAAQGIAAVNLTSRPWANLSEGVQETFRCDARAALEAAAPIIRAEALEAAADDFESNIGITEFDEQARRAGGRWRHIEESWEHQGPYMDWLRARAVAVRGGE